MAKAPPEVHSDSSPRVRCQFRTPLSNMRSCPSGSLGFGLAWRPIVEDDSQEGIVDLKSAIVTNEPQFSEFIHKKIDPLARSADHFREHLLGYFREYSLRVFLLAISGKQQKSAREPFLGRVK